ncbi:MAG TPA: GntR family transcriptional regulator [Acetobacteraceae bacterium]|nr:GntR family transcriptional regulator [Acetobacteraceae bacterium]
MTPAGFHPAPREDGVALWRQIANALEAEIAAATLAPGARLPTEAQLAARFAVNRHTVRRALEEMSRNGLIRVEQGRGSFVAEDVLD